MKNKFLILALLVIFVSVSFIGCGGDSPKMVKEITVTQNGSDGWILSWEAVGKNVVGYQVLGKMEDKATVITLKYGDNERIITTAGGGSINTDPDKYYAYVDRINYNVYISGSYYFGVRTFSTETDYSNIRWTKDKYALVKFTN
jgi:hypothetical protein